MPTRTVADPSRRRAALRQERSQETKRALVQAAVALWRVHGYAETTVADVCRAAGVSKGLFYFYFPRKEDVLAEIGLLSSQAAERTVAERLRRPYTVGEVVAAALADLERSMRRNPPALVVETVLEGYRYEHRILAGEAPAAGSGLIFGELFSRARADGLLPAPIDTAHLARLAQSLVSEGARHWAAGAYGDRSFTEVVSADIGTLLAGFAAGGRVG